MCAERKRVRDHYTLTVRDRLIDVFMYPSLPLKEHDLAFLSRSGVQSSDLS